MKRNVRVRRSVVGVSRSECFSVEAEMYGMMPRMYGRHVPDLPERSLISSCVFTRSLYWRSSEEKLSLPFIMSADVRNGVHAHAEEQDREHDVATEEVDEEDGCVHEKCCDREHLHLRTEVRLVITSRASSTIT